MPSVPVRAPLSKSPPSGRVETVGGDTHRVLPPKGELRGY